MATLFQQNNRYYISVHYKNNRIKRSLGTSDLNHARKIANKLEPKLFIELITGKNPRATLNLSLPSLISHFLAYDHGWSKNTHRIYKDSLNHYLKHGFPSNKSYRAMVTRCLNRCYRWGHMEGLIDKPKHFKGGNDFEARTRVFNADELSQILSDIQPYKFQLFVRFAYYTGTRQGEIKYLTDDNIKNAFVLGKSGKRQIKITSQAQAVLSEVGELWNYSKNYICLKFKENMEKLEIPDARFHDLRRTFGYNLIKQGMPIYQVSKLLGHASVTTTEKHYAPLLATDVEEFVL
ncbi:MAG: site-specific integrase [Anaerolineales bacterium]|nr:site-specific integrase [Anaerolineales bacterium]